MITSLSQLDLNKSYTYSDYLTWQLEEYVELIKGKIFRMSPAPNRKHQDISLRLSAYLFNYFEHTTCNVYHAPFDVRLPKKNQEQITTVLQPDLCIVCDSAKLDEQGCVGAPDLVVEILSPSNSHKEMKEKYEIYEESGVREYWVVDPNQKFIHIFILENEKFIGKQPIVYGDTLQSHIFPNLIIDTVKIFK